MNIKTEHITQPPPVPVPTVRVIIELSDIEADKYAREYKSYKPTFGLTYHISKALFEWNGK